MARPPKAPKGQKPNGRKGKSDSQVVRAKPARGAIDRKRAAKPVSVGDEVTAATEPATKAATKAAPAAEIGADVAARKIRGRRVQAADLAQIYGVTPRTVVNWVNQLNPRPCPSWMEGRERWFDTADVADWRSEVRAHEVRRETESETPPQFALAQARKMAADAGRAELALERERAELVPAAEYQRRITEFVGGFAAVASGRLKSFERRIVRAKTPADARHLTDEIHRALMQGAQDYADQIEAELAAEVEAEEEA